MRYLLTGIAILGCGNDGVHHLADSGVDTPSIDASPDGPATGTVSITVVSVDDGPVANVAVHFIDPDGTLVATVPTDTTGVASATMHSGGSVTAVQPFAGNDVFTYAGVRIGDQLQLNEPAFSQPPPTNVTIDAPLDPGASFTRLYTSCGAAELQQGSGSGTGPVAVQLFGCPATIDIAVESFDASFTPIHALFQPDVAVTDGGTVTITNSYQALSPTTLSVANFPQTGENVTVSQGLATARGILVDAFQNSINVTTANGSGSGSLNVPAVAGAFGIEQIDLQQDGFSQRSVLAWGPYATSFTLDGSALLASYASSPVWDTTANAATYTIGTTGVTPDFEEATLDFTREAAGLTWTWHVVSPHATSIAIPHIPAGATDFNPTATDSAFVERLDAFAVTGGYDVARAHAFDVPFGEGFVTQTAGQVSFEQLPQALIRRPARAPQVWRQRSRTVRRSSR